MRTVRVSENIVSLSEFKSHAASWFERLNAASPVVITQNGRAAGVLLSPCAYDELVERMAFLEAVARGIEDVESGRTVSHASIVAEASQRYRRIPSK
jgi:prevent-host-death family protein